MKHTTCRLGTALLAVIVLLAFCTPALRAATPGTSVPKEEIVYGVLETDGSVRELHVVNHLDTTGITQPHEDFGSYREVRSLSSPDPLKFDGTSVLVPAGAPRYTYQGTL